MSVCPTRGIISHHTPKTPKESSKVLEASQGRLAIAIVWPSGLLQLRAVLVFNSGNGSFSLLRYIFLSPQGSCFAVSGFSFSSHALSAHRTWVLMPVTSAPRPSSPPQIHTPLRSRESGLLFSEYGSSTQNMTFWSALPDRLISVLNSLILSHVFPQRLKEFPGIFGL